MHHLNSVSVVIGIVIIGLGLYLIYFTYINVKRIDRLMQLYIGSAILIFLGIIVMIGGVEAIT